MLKNSIKSFFILLAFFIYEIMPVTGQAISKHSMYENAKMMLSLSGYDTISAAYKEFNEQFLNELHLPGSFSNKFDSLECVSFLYPPDSSFRIMSWQAPVARDKYAYSCYIQTHDSLFVLKPSPSYFNHSSFNTLELSHQAWYGCLYYGIKSFVHDRQSKYVIFGYQQPGPFSARKIMDVLWFDNGAPVLGNPVFCNKKTKQCNTRMTLEYDSRATIKLNYDPEYGLIIFDHLIKGASPDMYGQTVNMTDGSYDAYKLKKNGTWEFVDMLWHDKQKEPPTDKPKKSQEQGKKDIFGR